MTKRVVVIASGETERQALPALLRTVCAEAIELLEVRYPSGHRDLTRDLARDLITASWWSRLETMRPQKFVILLDADKRSEEDTLRRFGDAPRIPGIDAPILLAVARQHLEAWFWADHQGLRAALGRDLGAVRDALADDIDDPKRRLQNLLDTPYTSRESRRLAEMLDPGVIEARSPSFAAFCHAVRNGTR